MLGDRLRRHRLAAGATILSIAQRVGVSKGYLSRIENGQSVPSIAVLARLSSTYGVPIATFLEGDGQGDARISVVRRDERLPLNRDGAELGYVYEAIAYRKADRRVECFITTLPAVKSPRHMYRHAGEELFYVLQGQVHFLYGGCEYILNAGDCVYFDASVEHRGESYNDTTAQALVVIIPPAEGRQVNNQTPQTKEARNAGED
ncbi:MAG: helix-turn-helix domain-containing protein [Rhodospirillaceae bacterium]|nr:helix-turn-helix domain-containing protein [Rhodospirillaceae bacterium]